MNRLSFLKRLLLGAGAIAVAPLVSVAKQADLLPTPIPEIPKDTSLSDALSEENPEQYTELELSDDELIPDNSGFSDYESFSDDSLYDNSPSLCATTSQPFIIQIENKTASIIEDVQILGACRNRNSNVENYGNPKGIQIDMGIAHVTYGMMLAQSETKPFTVGMTYLQTPNPSQLLELITVKQEDANGNICTKTLQPILNPHNHDSGTMALKNMYPVDGYTTLILRRMLPNTKMNLYLYPSNEIKSRATLIGGVVPVAYSSPKSESDKQTLTLSDSALKALKHANLI